MKTTTDDGREEEKLLQALGETWSRMDQTFQAEPAPLPNWASMISAQRRLSKQKLWKELAVLWSIGIPLLGVMFLLAAGLQPVFWILEAAATITAIPLLIAEFKRASRIARGEI